MKNKQPSCNSLRDVLVKVNYSPWDPGYCDCTDCVECTCRKTRKPSAKPEYPVLTEKDIRAAFSRGWNYFKKKRPSAKQRRTK